MSRYRSLFTLGCALLLLSSVFVADSTAIEVVPKVSIDRPVVPVDTTVPVYVLVQFDIPKPPPDPDGPRPAVNLGMVLDRSGSMSDKGKIEYARTAAITVVDQMLPTDRLAVVEYDEVITLLWPSTPVESPDLIKARIAELEPRGATNLVGGMMKGVDEVSRTMLERGINRVILLSDGLANRGVTDPNEIREMVREARMRGISISTMGLGLQYNEDLMQMIAEHSGGNYYYIENPKQMRGIFEREMGTMFATVARDVSATVHANSLVSDVTVFGYVTQGEKLSPVIDIGNLYAGEKLSLVLRLKFDAESEGALDLGTVEISYTDANDNSAKVFTTPISVSASTDSTEIAAAENREVSVEASLVEADEYHEQQVKLFESGDADNAMKNLNALKSSLIARNSSLGDIQLEKKIEALTLEEAKLEMAQNDADSRSSYLKNAKVQMYNAQKGKRGMYLMKEGDSSFEVKALQKALADAGHYTGEINGDFDSAVTEAVKKFQQEKGLKVDGVAGPMTLQQLGLY